MNLQYAAGLIDGEGYIGIQRAGGSYQVRLKVSMSDKGRAALDSLAATLGGKVNPDREATEVRRESFTWALTGERACALISDLRPYLLVKGPAADVALEFDRLHKSLERSPRRGRIWTPEALERAAMLRERIQEANRRGPDPVPPTLPPGTPTAVYRWGWWWEPEESLLGPVEFTGQLPQCGVMISGHVYSTPRWLER